MKGTCSKYVGASGLLAVLLLVCGTAAAQGYGSGQSQPPQQQPLPDKSKQPDALTLDTAPPPVNAEEDAAYKEYDAVPLTDPNKKIASGEAFLQKYPQSRYRPPIYSVLTNLYLQIGQVQKMEEIGEKEIALNPNDVQVLAVLGQTIPRVFNPSEPGAMEKLTKAEEYAKRAIEVTPTIPKPASATEEGFTNAKNVTLAMAHSGLGLIYVRKGKFDQAIPELQQSVTLDPNPDPVNYYLLGLAQQKTSHFDDAVAAYNKCAAIASSMQARCKSSADEAKKLSSTELSAPK